MDPTLIAVTSMTFATEFFKFLNSPAGQRMIMDLITAGHDAQLWIEGHLPSNLSTHVNIQVAAHDPTKP